jgi:hypothetical protein
MRQKSLESPGKKGSTFILKLRHTPLDLTDFLRFSSSPSLLPLRCFPKLIDTDFTDTLTGKFLAGPNVMSLEGDRWKAHRVVSLLGNSSLLESN